MCIVRCNSPQPPVNRGHSVSPPVLASLLFDRCWHCPFHLQLFSNRAHVQPALSSPAKKKKKLFTQTNTSILNIFPSARWSCHMSHSVPAKVLLDNIVLTMADMVLVTLKLRIDLMKSGRALPDGDRSGGDESLGSRPGQPWSRWSHQGTVLLVPSERMSLPSTM